MRLPHFLGVARRYRVLCLWLSPIRLIDLSHQPVAECLPEQRRSVQLLIPRKSRKSRKNKAKQNRTKLISDSLSWFKWSIFQSNGDTLRESPLEGDCFDGVTPAYSYFAPLFSINLISPVRAANMKFSFNFFSCE